MTPTSLGELLRRAREARGLTIAQVEQETRIRRRHLEALEAGELRVVPAPVFTRGLVRSYARFLGVDPVEAAELLNKEERRQESIGVLPPVEPLRVPTSRSSLPGRAVVVALTIAALGIVVGLSLPRYQFIFAPATAIAQDRVPPGQEVAIVVPAPTAVAPSAATATAAPTAVPTNTAGPSPTPLSEARATATAAAAIRGVTVEAKIGGRVWAQVESDGQVVFAGILMPGERKVWRAERRLSLYAGDAGLIDVTFNGQALGRLGAKGEVVKQEWSSSR